MSTTEILIAGFGGQGVLFTGKFLAYKGMLEGKQISWLPSYGPEMRGGTANCSVILSDIPIGSPIVTAPDCLIAMNLPSLDKYENDVGSGGLILADSTLIGRGVMREDVRVFYVPATQMAQEAGIPTLANMIMAGKFLREGPGMTYENTEEALKKVVSAKHMDLFELNLKAIGMGYHFKGEESLRI